MSTVIIDIAGTIKELLKWVAVQVLVFLALVGVGLSAPFLFSVGALWLAWRYAEYAWIWAVIYLILGPFACSFWMILLSAKLETQRSDDDPLNRSLMASVFMVVGFFGSLFAEGVFTYAAHRLSVIPNHLMIFFVFAPLAVFAPCWLVVLYRLRGIMKDWLAKRPPGADDVAKRKAWEQKEAAWKQREAVWMSRLGHVPLAAYFSKDQPDSVFDIEEEIKRLDLHRVETKNPQADNTSAPRETNSRQELALGWSAFAEDCRLLGVHACYTLDELNAARRTKAAQWHPDRLDGMAPELKKFANEQLTRLNLAHERLKKHVKSRNSDNRGTVQTGEAI